MAENLAAVIPADLAPARPLESGGSARDQLVELMNRHERKLCGYIRVLLREEDAVFDCAQETFVRAYEHLSRGRQVNSQWLYKVARNRAIDHIRRRGKLESDGDAFDGLIGAETGTSDAAIRARLTLQQMAPADRELLYLAIVDRLKTEEIAATLGIRSGAARARLCRARERFRQTYRSIP